MLETTFKARIEKIRSKMNYILLKSLAAIIILSSAILGGLIPLYSKYRHQASFLFHGTFFARGIFLGIGLAHLLPTAFQNLSDYSMGTRSLYVLGICAITVLILFLIEHGSTQYIKNKPTPTINWLPYLLMTILSIHSIIAGAILGIGNSIASITIIFIAIIAHKGAAAFALSIEMLNHKIRNQIIIKIILLFSIMTPLGILFGSAIEPCLRHESGLFISGIFNAIGAGTFLYIAAFNCLKPPPPCKTHRFFFNHVFYFLMGIALMGVVAIWL